MAHGETLRSPDQPVTLAPVHEQDRVLTLDVLRAFALLGVVIANVWLWFSGIAWLFPAYREELLQPSLDSAVFYGISVFVAGKAMSTFSFLFGLGFAVQMLRAQARGRSVVPVYVRRLTVLFFVGLAHMAFLWYGDILAAYAVLGFPLLLFRNRADRTLLAWAGGLLVAVPLLLGGLPLILGLFGVALPDPSLDEIAQRNAATLATFQTGTYGEIVQENLRQGGKFYLGRKAPAMLYALGLFLLGLYAGRRRIFEQVPAHRGLLRRVAMWGIPIGLAGSLAATTLQALMDPAAMIRQPGLMLLVMSAFTVGTVPLAAGYVSTVALLLQRDDWRRRLSVMAPVGRMALTNYLSQSVVMVLIFNSYGGGLIGRTGPAFGLALALAVFAVQMVVSRLWLQRFRFGPMEWLWRSLTYGALQPMAIRPQAVGVAPLS